MPAISVVPAPTPFWNLDIIWPDTSTKATGAAFTQTAENTHGPFGSRVNLWSAPSGAGSSLGIVTHNNELFAYQFINNRQCGQQNFAPCVPLTQQSWPVTFRQPDSRRVYWWQWMMSCTGGNPTEETGVQVQVTAGAGAGWITAAFNQAGFGIVGDGAGAWRFFTKKGPGTYITTAFTNPYAITEMMTFDCLIYPATGSGPAAMVMYCNGLQIISRLWGAGTTLPLYSEGVANSCNFVMSVQANNGAAIGLNLAHLRIRQGNYDITGAVL